MISLILRYIINLLLAIDQAANSLLLGHPDETISSRLGRTIGVERYFWVKWFRIFVDCLFFFDKIVDKEVGIIIRHCEKSIMPLEQQSFRTVTQYEIWCWNKEVEA